MAVGKWAVSMSFASGSWPIPFVAPTPTYFSASMAVDIFPQLTGSMNDKGQTVPSASALTLYYQNPPVDFFGNSGNYTGRIAKFRTYANCLTDITMSAIVVHYDDSFSVYVDNALVLRRNGLADATASSWAFSMSSGYRLVEIYLQNQPSVQSNMWLGLGASLSDFATIDSETTQSFLTDRALQDITTLPATRIGTTTASLNGSFGSLAGTTYYYWEYVVSGSGLPMTQSAVQTI